MAVPMDSASELSSREHVQHLYNKNVEYKNKWRRSAQSRIPLDLNAWLQMRENFETIILEDYAFAEQHEIEFALWQLHYVRIEELRAHFNGAIASSHASVNGQAEKSGSVRSDRIPKIRAQFKTFVSEASGFYHELMLKIRSKYGLPLGYFSDYPDDEASVSSKDRNGSAEFKKGLVSCHRCLIYLGDLARYKGVYGEGEMKSRDFAAASGYYMQASSCCPSSGNPHHQLAILASYSGDEFVSFYRYFRSLAVESPFSVARDNLIIAFEKNRQHFAQMALTANVKISPAKVLVARNGKVRTRAETRFSAKDQKKVEANHVKEKQFSTVDILKAFNVKFVRLHGILFTRTSMETFQDVLLMAKNEFLELLLSCSEEVCTFGSDDAESGLFIIRLVAMIIFTVHNANRESDDQSYAEILQRTVVLPNAYTAAFEFMAHIVDRCIKFHDSLSSFLLPGVLVFVEWLACYPEIVIDCKEEKLANARTYFWNSCVALFNKLVSAGSICEDETCFSKMSKYEEGEASSSNRLALGEDFELRGFLPLQPGQQNLDFSIKPSFRNEDRKARVHRIISAAKSFSCVVRVGKKVVYFDQKLKKFAIGEPQVSHDLAASSVETPEPTGASEEKPVEMKLNAVPLEPISVTCFDGDDEEDIVFKPSMAEKHPDEIVLTSTSGDLLKTVAIAPFSDVENNIGSAPSMHDSMHGHDAFGTSAAASSLLSNDVAHHAVPNQPSPSNWLFEHKASVMNGLRNFSLMEDGHSLHVKVQEQYGPMQPPSNSQFFEQPVKLGNGSLQPGSDAFVLSSVSSLNGTSFNTVSVLPFGAKKNPVSRPLRHIGPPPGFTPASANEATEVTVIDGNPLMDNYSWLDGYQTPFSSLSSGLNSLTNLSREAFGTVNKDSSMNGIVAFPFPGKQASSFQIPIEKSKVWPDYQYPQPLKLYQEHQPKHQYVQKGNQQPVPVQPQFQSQSLWEGNFLV